MAYRRRIRNDGVQRGGNCQAGVVILPAEVRGPRWWLAFKCRADGDHAAATALLGRHPEVEALWTPWQRVEVFNAFRQAERAGWVAAGESRRIAIEVAADGFVSFDAEQNELAEAAGLPLITRRSRSR